MHFIVSLRLDVKEWRLMLKEAVSENFNLAYLLFQYLPGGTEE